MTWSFCRYACRKA